MRHENCKMNPPVRVRCNGEFVLQLHCRVDVVGGTAAMRCGSEEEEEEVNKQS